MNNLKKIDFRNLSKNKLKGFSKLSINQNFKATKRLDKILKSLKFKNILFYIPLPNETNIVKILHKFRRKKNIFVPFMVGKSFKIVKYRMPLVKKKFNIKEPRNSKSYFSKIDVAIVPVLGVDGNLRRIGYGKGMYDRFFNSQKTRPIIIFIQNAKCFTKEKIADDYDIDADFYITPNDILIKRGKNGIRNYDSRRRSTNKWCISLPNR